uniref:lipocalin family protein n=1 Tax=Parabacteroides distasonis TaxID=823 RepID=UPI0040260107
MGKWFEIARFDHRFEHNLVGATVEYSFLPNGDIEVVNSGYWGNFFRFLQTSERYSQNNRSYVS